MPSPYQSLRNQAPWLRATLICSENPGASRTACTTMIRRMASVVTRSAPSPPGQYKVSEVRRPAACAGRGRSPSSRAGRAAPCRPLCRLPADVPVEQALRAVIHRIDQRLAAEAPYARAV